MPSRFWLLFNGVLNRWEFAVADRNNECFVNSTGARGAFDYLVCRCDGSEAFIYRNGVFAGSSPYTGTINNGSTAVSLNGDIFVGMLAIFPYDLGDDFALTTSADPLSIYAHDEDPFIEPFIDFTVPPVTASRSHSRLDWLRRPSDTYKRSA